MKRTLVLLAAVGLFLAPGAVAQLQDQGWGNQFSPGQAREAVKEGRALSYSKIEDMLERQYGGYVGRADLYNGEDGRPYYDVVWISKDGRKIDLLIDAQTGKVIEQSGVGQH